MELWIPFTLLAVVMQALRTAGQKRMAGRLSVAATTLARFLFGLPFALLYWLALLARYRQSSSEGGEMAGSAGEAFLLWCVLAAFSQVLATGCLVRALQSGSFAVGSALARSEALLAALAGACFFDSPLNVAGYLAVSLGVLGSLLTGTTGFSWRRPAQGSLAYGLLSALGFALASLWLREGILQLELPRLLGAATALLFMLLVQTAICLLWLLWHERRQWSALCAQWRACLFIGFCSVAGSIGWFTAMGLQEVALVKTLGQAELFVSLAITWRYFREKVSPGELLGMGLIALSVIILLQSGL